MSSRSEPFAPPQAPPTWSRADKSGVGTAYSGASRLWYSLHCGHVTEVFYPTIDQPQIRDWRLAFVDARGRCDDETHAFAVEVERLCPSLGYRVRETPPTQAYAVEKTIIPDPHRACLLQRVVIRPNEGVPVPAVHITCTPRLSNAARGNSGTAVLTSGRTILVAGHGERWLALGGERSLIDPTVLGNSNGDDGITLVGQVDQDDGAFTLGLAFGGSRHAAITMLLQSLAIPFDEQLDEFRGQWRRAVATRRALEQHASDGGNLYRASYSLLVGHEDKTFGGATVASLAIPWGEARDANDGQGGYHLIWTRDLVQCGTALLAAKQTTTPLRMLIYLAAAQKPDGSFLQCCWTDGRPYYDAVQLDEVAFPILLARRLRVEQACNGFDPVPMVSAAARYLLLNGPITEQERWEEAGGYSPSTLAAIITGCVCAAVFAEEHGDDDGADLLRSFADWVRSHIEDWTVTHFGSLLEKTPRHFVRLNPTKPGDALEAGAVDRALLHLSSQPAGHPTHVPAQDVVDAGFLELVRHGIIAADDPLVADSLRVVDHVLKVKTPFGDAWRRYNHDGYGQAAAGQPYAGQGVGRAWPLLTGERGHAELAAGRDVRPYVSALERFAGPTGMLPEQVWDEADIPATGMFFGCPTGSASPLLWAHAEYVKLLRSIEQGAPYDRFDDVAERYLRSRGACEYEFWTFAHPTPQIEPGRVLRLCDARPFILRFSCDEWTTIHDEPARQTYGVYVADITPTATCKKVIFTFRWLEDDHWHSGNFEAAVRRH